MEPPRKRRKIETKVNFEDLPEELKYHIEDYLGPERITYKSFMTIKLMPHLRMCVHSPNFKFI